MRELQVVLNFAAVIFKWLPYVAAYAVAMLALYRFGRPLLTSKDAKIDGTAMGYALAGLAAFLWAVGR